jgi:hypothetical protein
MNRHRLSSAWPKPALPCICRDTVLHGIAASRDGDRRGGDQPAANSAIDMAGAGEAAGIPFGSTMSSAGGAAFDRRRVAPRRRAVSNFRNIPD